jgi:hypothetical protein
MNGQFRRYSERGPHLPGARRDVTGA